MFSICCSCMGCVPKQLEQMLNLLHPSYTYTYIILLPYSPIPSSSVFPIPTHCYPYLHTIYSLFFCCTSINIPVTSAPDSLFTYSTWPCTKPEQQCLDVTLFSSISQILSAYSPALQSLLVKIARLFSRSHSALLPSDVT